MTLDLFSQAPVPGLALEDDFIDAAEEETLLGLLQGVEVSPFRFQQYRGKRLVKTFGWRYDFTDSSFELADPIPDWLGPLRARAAAFAGLAADEFVHVLVNRYDPGAGIGWHRDRPLFEKVVGVSLGASTVMNFRRRADGGFRRAKVLLEPRSAYLLSGQARHDWEHGIAPHKALRWSITFRSLSEQGRRRAAA